MHANGSIAGHAGRFAVVACCTAVVTAGLAPHAQAEDDPCVPSVDGYGPTITIDVDYQDPTRSSVDYDSSDFSVKVDPCV